MFRHLAPVDVNAARPARPDAYRRETPTSALVLHIVASLYPSVRTRGDKSRVP